MGTLLLAAARCLTGVALIVGASLWVRRRRVRGDLPLPLARLLERGLHYSTVGILAGFAAPPMVVLALTDVAHLMVALLSGWFGMSVGLGLDARVLRHTSPLPAAFQGVRAAAVVLAVLAGGSLGLQAVDALALPSATAFLLMLCGICVARPPSGTVLDRRHQRARPHRQPAPLAAAAGILLAGLGAMQARSVPFRVQLPFAPAGRALLVDSLVGEAAWCLFLGALTGLAVDMLTRGADRSDLVLLMLGGLALGSGVAAVLGMEPLWVGLASGLWLINCTLRRPEILRSVQASHGVLRAALYLGVGWFIGSGVIHQGLDLRALVWVLVCVLLLRTAGGWLGGHLAAHLLGARAPKRLQASAGDLPQLGDVGLVVAASMGVAAPGPTGVGIVVGVALSHWVLTLLQLRTTTVAGEGLLPGPASLRTASS
ncbi:MAG: hypothetical protein AB1505_06210 [Candidatus Latescibacterota bacterium]